VRRSGEDRSHSAEHLTFAPAILVPAPDHLPLNMRAFIAIDLPETVRAELRQQQSAFRGICPDGRWTRPEGIHLTLKFLGQISDDQATQATDALKGLSPFEAFSVEVKSFGFFPDARRPRVFLGRSRDTAEFGCPGRTGRTRDGEVRLCARGPPLFTAFDAGAFQDSAATASAPISSGPSGPAGEPSLGTFKVSEFFLFESKLSPQGQSTARWLVSLDERRRFGY